MPRYEVYVQYSVSQIVEVDADSIDEAIGEALQEVYFELVSDVGQVDVEPRVLNVSEGGEVVWDGSELDPSVPQ